MANDFNSKNQRYFSSSEILTRSLFASIKLNLIIMLKIDFHSIFFYFYSLLQARLSGIPIENTALQMETEKMVAIAKRMVSSLIEYFQAEQFPNRSFNSVLSATRFTKSLNTSSWCDRPFYHALSLNESDENKLQRHGIKTMDQLLAANPREIEDVRAIVLPINH